MLLDRLRYELKIMGRWALLAPLVLVLIFSLFAVFLGMLHADPQRFLLAIPEMLLPLLAGVCVGIVATQDPSLELHLTMPHRYQRTGLLRLLVLLVCIAVISGLFINGMWVTNLLSNLMNRHLIQSLSPLARFLIVQGVWLAPLLWCIAIGFCLALILQGWTGNIALLAGIWIAEIIFKDYIALTDWLRPMLLFPTTLLVYSAGDPLPSPEVWALMNKYWLSTRLDLLITALVVFLLANVFLRNNERLLRGTTAE